MPVDHDAATGVIESRIQDYGLVSLAPTTPLLKYLIGQCSSFHSEALKLPHIRRKLMAQLDNFHELIMEHWGEIYGNLEDYAQLTAHMSLFLMTLASQLASEYSGTPSSSGAENATWEQRRVELIRQHRDSGSESDSEDSEEGLYQDTVVSPVEELMLDLEHVENRLVAAAEAPAEPRSPVSIHQYIEQCDWPSVAKSLVRDRELTLSILKADKELSTRPESFGGDAGTKVLQGISDIEVKYFADLSSPTDFTLSKYAKRRSPPSTEQTLTVEPKTIGKHLKLEKTTAWASARSIAVSIKGHFGEVRSRAHQAGSQPNSVEEKSPLLVTDSKKAD